MNNARANRIRIGILAFPTSGLVATVAALVPGIGINPAVDPAGFAQGADYVGLADLLGIVSLVFLLFGFQALHAFLEKNSVDRSAFVGVIVSVVGVALFLPFLGIIAFAGPVAGRFYFNGQVQSVSMISEATGIRTLLHSRSAASLYYPQFSGRYSSPWLCGDQASCLGGRRSPMLFGLP